MPTSAEYLRSTVTLHGSTCLISCIELQRLPARELQLTGEDHDRMSVNCDITKTDAKASRASKIS